MCTDWEENIKTDLVGIRYNKMEWIQAWDQYTGLCERGNGRLGSIKAGNF
jgi:hypothetical protein